VTARLPLFLLWLRRDIKSRYAGSMMGIFWAVLSPLFTISLFYVLFAHIFKVRVPELASDTGFFYYLLTGILPWLAMSEGLARSTGVLAAYEQFLQKQPFPVAILPATAVIAALLPQVVGTIVLLFLLATNGLFRPSVLLYLPYLLIMQLAMTLGLGMALSILALHVRDLLQAVPISLQFVFYATPILYPLSMVPAEYHYLFALNPFACLIMGYQHAFLGTSTGNLVLLAIPVWAGTLGSGGYLLFRILKPTLGETL